MRSLSIIVLSVLFCAFSAVAAAAEPDWSDPESIDVYDRATGAFLEIDTDALFDTAWEAYLAGDYELAAQYYLALLSHDKSDEINIYNVAGCLGLLGEAELAAYYLEQTVAAGYTDMGWVAQDPDFDPVRETEVFSETFERLSAEIEEQEAGKGNIVYFEAPTKLRARVWFPENYDPRETYPLLIGLHGFGSYPDRFINLYKRLEGEEFIYLSPQAPYPFLSGLGEVGYSWGDWIHGEGLPRGSWQLSEEYVVKVIEEATAHYNADKVILMGFSQGAGMTLTAGIHNHQLVDGLIAFGGWLDTNRISDDDLALAADRLRVVIAHGNEDGVVEFQSALDAVDKLEEADYDFYFHEFDGGHAVPEEALMAAWEWLMTEPVEDENDDEEHEE